MVFACQSLFDEHMGKLMHIFHPYSWKTTAEYTFHDMTEKYEQLFGFFPELDS